jgi:hypothetical protein
MDGAALYQAIIENGSKYPHVVASCQFIQKWIDKLS